MKKVWILRGLPGCGKTTQANLIRADYPSTVICSADDFFVGADGVYRHDPRLLGQAHADCMGRFVRALYDPLVECVVVDNTHTQRWEWANYKLIAEYADADVEVIDLYDGGCSDYELSVRNAHGVPVQAIIAMRKRYERN